MSNSHDGKNPKTGAQSNVKDSGAHEDWVIDHTKTVIEGQTYERPHNGLSIHVESGGQTVATIDPGYPYLLLQSFEQVDLTFEADLIGIKFVVYAPLNEKPTGEVVFFENNVERERKSLVEGNNTIERFAPLSFNRVSFEGGQGTSQLKIYYMSWDKV